MESRPSTSTERTPLVTPRMPAYAFESSLTARYKRRLRSFQCCICVGSIVLFGTALLISASYELDRRNRQDMTESITNETTATPDVVQPNLTLALSRQRAAADIATLLTISWPRPDADAMPWFGSHPSEAAVSAAVEQGTRALEARATVEATGAPLAGGTAAYRAARAVATAAAADQLARSGYAAHRATAFLALASSDVTGNVPAIGARLVGVGPRIAANVSWMNTEYCARAIGACAPARYRSADGTCSCLLRPSAGAALTPFRRALSPDYADGVGAPRGGRYGSLPSARAVSALVHRPRRDADSIFTVMLAVWGQFLDHDITATALSRGANGTAIACCSAHAETEADNATAHPECFPVRLERGDPYYDQYNLTCMEFVRSAPAPACNFGARQQLNQATAFIDGSVVYSPNPALTRKLRSGEGGRLRMAQGESGELLPPAEDPNDGCNRKDQAKQGKYCFDSGDARANENLHLTTMHLIWARQHNRIADHIQSFNPSWSDEVVFQEARKVIGAQMQHITYNEFLPIVIGRDVMRSAGIELQTSGYRDTARAQRDASENYADASDAPPDPSIANHFAAAAFRFAHTLLPSLMRSVEAQQGDAAWTHLHEMLFDPFPLYGARGVAGRALASAMNTRAASVNPHISAELSNHLFEQPSPTPSVGAQRSHAPCGLDLVSLNIQRGRDHGLPAYPRWRKHCGLSEPKTFGDLRGVLDDDSLERISLIYASVDDVDLYTGALSELPVGSRLLGATLTCLLTDQFARLRHADAYWYETSQQPQAFTPEQLKEIRKTTLASVLCANADGLPKAQRRVMESAGPDNPLLPCKEIPQLNWRFWQDTSAFNEEVRNATIKNKNDI